MNTPTATVRALHGFCAGGGRDVMAGETFVTTEANAREWVYAGHVERVVEAETPAEHVQHGDPETTNRDPIKRGRRWRNSA